MALLTIPMVVNDDPVPDGFGIREIPLPIIDGSESSSGGIEVNYYWG
jgi:hypothetical protein